MKDDRTLTAVAVGVVAGLFSGLFGIGGGTIIVPGLVYFVGLERKKAHGTSLAAVVPVSIASGLSYMLAGEIDWLAALVLIIGSITGVWFGTKLLHHVNQRAIGIGFVIMLVLSAIRLIVGAGDTGEHRSLTLVVIAGLIIGGTFVGLISGLLGIGGGAVLVPMMILGLGLPTTLAKGTSLAVIIVTSTVGTISNRRHLNVDLRLAAMIGIAGVISAFLGGRVSLGLPEKAADIAFGIFLLIISAKMTHDLYKGPSRDMHSEPASVESQSGT